MSIRTERVLLVTLLIVTGAAFLFTTLRAARERSDAAQRYHQLTLLRSMRLALNAALDTQMRALYCRDAQQFQQMKVKSNGALDNYRKCTAELSSLSDNLQTDGSVRTAFTDFENTHRQVMDFAERSSNRRAMNLATGPCVDQLQAIGLELEHPQNDSASDRLASRADALVSTQLQLVLNQYQTLLIPHILESSNQTMDELERRLARLDQQADESLKALTGGVVDDVTRRVDNLRVLHREIIQLSRENTNIHAEELTLHGQLAAMGKLEAWLDQFEMSLSRSVTSSVVPQHSASQHK